MHTMECYTTPNFTFAMDPDLDPMPFFQKPFLKNEFSNRSSRWPIARTGAVLAVMSMSRAEPRQVHSIRKPVTNIIVKILDQCCCELKRKRRILTTGML